jgi:uncharacterized protein YbaR (Trm112 family)
MVATASAVQKPAYRPRRYLIVAKIEGCMPVIDKELLDVLMCLFCEGDLELKEDESGLRCKNCKRVYPIRDGLPIMLKDQATIEA